MLQILFILLVASEDITHGIGFTLLLLGELVALSREIDYVALTIVDLLRELINQLPRGARTALVRQEVSSCTGCLLLVVIVVVDSVEF